MTRPKSNFEGYMILVGLLCAVALVFLLFTACPHNPSLYKCNGDPIGQRPTTDDVRMGNYDPDWVEHRANALGLRTVDYLHQVSSGRREP